MVVKGLATAVNGKREFKLHSNESTHIHVGDLYRHSKDAKDEVEILEVQTSSYFEEEDII